ncbi:MAG: hypothetical protein EBR82_72400 [Caulobacteraceae bacterium]|nr:hypothetical protein [Caulobacteraceae bacterium]
MCVTSLVKFVRIAKRSASWNLKGLTSQTILWMVTSILLWPLLVTAQTRTMVAGATKWKTSVGLVIQKFAENNMDKYIIAVAELGIFFLALALLETLVNFSFWFWENKRK